MTDRPFAGWGLALGEVRHRRTRPVGHAFRYPAMFIRVPVHRLDGAAFGGAWFGVNRGGLLGFRERDHGDGRSDLREWIARTLADAGLRADGDIWLDTFPRVFGYAFKPVSFWHCHDRGGALVAIVAEVNNTFGERHCYLLASPDGGPIRPGQTLEAAKAFHVSPFCQVGGHYRFRFLQAGRRLVARIEHHDPQGPLLLTSLNGEIGPVNARRCALALVRRPLFAIAVIARIHWQALRLWVKGVPFHAKPEPPTRFVSRGSP